MFSMRKMNPFLSLFLASCFFFISHSQTTSNTSSQHHCLPNQSHTLLQLRQEFVQKRLLYSDYWRYDYYNGSYPKMKSWKADSDCCSWDGVTCDPENGHVVGLNLTNSWLNGRLNSNSTLFSLRHLHKLNLALNNFSSSTIPSQFGHLARLTHLNLSHSFLSGQIPSEISWLSNLVSLDLSYNYFKYFVGGPDDFKDLNLRRIDLEALVQNMTYLRELHLDEMNISSSLPQSLANLSSLTSLSLSWGSLLGEFPSNTFVLPKIQAIDLTYNEDLAGFLPKFRSGYHQKYFKTWNAMLMVHGKINSKPEYMADHSGYYEDSITVMNKGLEMELVKILTIFIAIDLSNNRFCGEIPNTMGNLKELIVLNLSSNSFTGPIPSSFGNLIELQSLDLSQNKFLGEIPQQLISLTFLAYLNLSQNQLIGPIPQGGQFWTFQSSSFEGNLELCGSPLLMKCENNETPTSTLSYESSFGEGFNWKAVVIGYACGLVIGLLIGHVVISRRAHWFMKTFRVKLHR
uniref:Leucine-rich repeat-containing N-terminal plant-type domain-containing protein n=1 Tax=Fagus sylvatica TaxID=28930 RepID=A0A2N9HIT6_FAGSY